MKVVVVGNGIVGLTTAFRLSQRASTNDRVLIVGRKERAGSATLAAAAMMNCFAEVEAGGLETELDQYRFELSRQAAARWPEFERQLRESYTALNLRGKDGDWHDEAGLHRVGTFVINNSAADDLDDENFQAIVSALQAFDEDFEFVSPDEIPNYFPEQRYRALRALHIRREGWLNPRQLVGLLDAVLHNHPNVVFVDEDVANIDVEVDQVSSMTTTTGTVVEGDKFVLASGATVTDLLAASKLDLGIQRVFYGVGVSIEIASPDYVHTRCVRTPNRGLACGLYTVPYLGGLGHPQDHILVGASNFISATPYAHGRLTSVEGLMRGAIEQINANFYRADLIQVNVGWRPTSQDTFPLIGVTCLSNLIVATGTKRDGLHLSPVLSEKIAALVNGETLDKKFSWFAPDRSPLRPLTRDRAISKAIRHQINAAYQHGFVPAQGRMRAQLESTFRDGLERLHDQVGATDWGIPPEMLDMYRYGHAVP